MLATPTGCRIFVFRGFIIANFFRFGKRFFACTPKGGLTKPCGAVILKVTPGEWDPRRPGVTSWRVSLKFRYEVTARLEAGRLLLFIGRNYEADNTYDNQCVLEQFTVCYHWTAPLSKVRGARSCPLWRGHPPTVSLAVPRKQYHSF